ncbi:MAG: hypothetical protein IPP98_00490 [Gemmatimonadetes bacterium]|nr:hypothetical protein [Gemmatimonadota bacterium]MBL0177592.1 hypothetical protein [Gemmatimonadota bacterium]
MSRRPASAIPRLVAALLLTLAAPAVAQQKSAPAAAPSATSLVGTWAGSVTVPFGDSSIVAPVSYTFVAASGGVGGTAMVPGQGSGTISNVVRTGAHVQFRVTVAAATAAAAGATSATPKLLEHDGTLGADGALEGLVNLAGQPVAKFKVTPKK